MNFHWIQVSKTAYGSFSDLISEPYGFSQVGAAVIGMARFSVPKTPPSVGFGDDF
jgi:hypothetical protein